MMPLYTADTERELNMEKVQKEKEIREGGRDETVKIRQKESVEGKREFQKF